jgi:tRNA(Ile)-lysidine synthase
MHPLERQLASTWPPADWQDVGLVLAVSGGADSVALARAMVALKPQGAGCLAVAHFNHHLRGADSHADQQFVEALARQLSLDCAVGHADATRLDSTGNGLEAAARAQRYDFLRQTAESRGARYVVVAHTADDQAETVLHHVLRGTGLAGLAGMPRTRPLGPAVTLIRPLLQVRRHEVLAYLTALEQPFREDTTNLDPQFTRNRIRHALVPLLTREFSPGVVDSLLRLSTLAADAQRVIDCAADGALERAIVAQDGAGATLDCQTLAGQDRHLVRETFVALWRRRGWPMQDMGYAQWNLLADMALGESANGKRDFPGAITAQREGARLSVRARKGQSC